MSDDQRPPAAICPHLARALHAVLMDASERLEDTSQTAEAKAERLKAIGRIQAIETLMYEVAHGE